MEASPRRIERRIVLAVPPAEVWAALTRSERLSSWFGADVSLHLRPGGRCTFRWPDGWDQPGVMEEVQPHRNLFLRRLPLARHPNGSTRLLPSSRIEFSLERLGEGTQLTVVESRLLGHGGDSTAPALAEMPFRDWFENILDATPGVAVGR